MRVLTITVNLDNLDYETDQVIEIVKDVFVDISVGNSGGVVTEGLGEYELETRVD